MDSFGVFEVASSGADEQRLVKQAQTDKLAAAVYDVREKHGSWLFGANDLDGFNDRAKLAFVSICETIEPHMHARTGVYRRVMKAMEKEWRERQACYPGCDENEAHAKKFHKDDDKKESRRQAGQGGETYLDPAGRLRPKIRFEDKEPEEPEMPETYRDPIGREHTKIRFKSRRHDAEFETEHNHPELHTQETFQDHQGEPLVPEGNFESYKDSVDQGAPSKVDHDFVHGGGEVREHNESGDDNFVPTVTGRRRQAVEVGEAQPAAVTGAPGMPGQASSFSNVPGVGEYGVPSPMDKAGQRYPEYQLIARMLYATDDPSAAPPGGGAGDIGPGAGMGAPPMADPGAAIAPPAPISSTPAGSGAPVTAPMAPMTASRSEYEIITAMLRQGGGVNCPECGKYLHDSIARSGHGHGPNGEVYDADPQYGHESRGEYMDRGRGGLPPTHTGGLKHADRNYLQQADEAITKVLNEKAEEFQNTIAPLQQALITIQQAEQLTNPLNVSPPAGTVNVLPQGAQGNQAPQGQGGIGADPAAAGLAAGGAPAPDPTQQLQARRKRGGQGKGSARLAGHPDWDSTRGPEPWPSERHEQWMAENPDAYPEESPYHHEGRRLRADVVNDFNKWVTKAPGLPSGGEADIDNFAQQKKTGPRAINKLKQQQGITPTGAPAPRAAPSSAPGGASNYGIRAKTKRAQKPLIADPNSVWSKSPSTVHAEFANRMANGGGPDDVYRQLIAEITDHHSNGHIDNRDAHRAANEAFGRLLMSKRRQAVPGPVLPNPAAPPVPTPPGSPNSSAIGQAPGSTVTPGTNITDQANVIGGQRPSPGYGYSGNPLEGSRRKAGQRKQAWSGWGPDQSPKRHKVAGWEWDNHLNGYVSTSHRKFQCSCGEPVNVPDYHNCKCGKIFNTYVVGTGGDKHQAAAEKFIAREVPVRDNVLVANRKKPKRRAGYDELSSAFDDAQEGENAFPSDHHPATPQGKSTPKDWHRRDVDMRWTS